jgi:alkyl hydroperoxide reductase subunit AhpC
MVFRTIVLFLIGGLLIQAGPRHPKNDFRELPIEYFLDNYYKPKNEIWICYFWATWCMNCVNSHKILEKLDADFKSQHVRLISLSLDENKSKWQEFIQEHPALWEQTYAADTPFDKKFRTYFGNIKTLPQLFIIKRDGSPQRVNYLNQLKTELQKTLEEGL